MFESRLDGRKADADCKSRVGQFQQVYAARPVGIGLLLLTGSLTKRDIGVMFISRGKSMHEWISVAPRLQSMMGWRYVNRPKGSLGRWMPLELADLRNSSIYIESRATGLPHCDRAKLTRIDGLNMP